MKETEDIIIRFIRGECSQTENEFILKRIREDSGFKKELIELKNIYTHESMPQTEATEKEYADLKKHIAKKESSKSINNITFNRKSDVAKIIGKILSYSIAASLIILLALNLKFNWLVDSATPQKTEVLTSLLPTESVNTLYTAKGMKGETILPDGSKVILNSDSKITYPAKFTGSTRDIEFSGEGYFEVRQDSLCPMVIRCNKNFKVMVYGTTFNIKSYNDDDNAKTTLISGSIKVIENIGGKEFIRNIAPNQTYIIERITQTTKIEKKVNTEKVCQWKDGILSFDSTPLHEAAKILERWHGVKISITNNSLLDIPITATFTTESIVQIMDLFKFSAFINYEIKDNVVVIK